MYLEKSQPYTSEELFETEASHPRRQTLDSEKTNVLSMAVYPVDAERSGDVQ
ncbi:hypothetical protein JQN58_17935 [Aneurinibacillus sp. BA2021]|nr:hypothetical protein [Aneurinibacillus sp. BA2021]